MFLQWCFCSDVEVTSHSNRLNLLHQDHYINTHVTARGKSYKQRLWLNDTACCDPPPFLLSSSQSSTILLFKLTCQNTGLHPICLLSRMSGCYQMFVVYKIWQNQKKERKNERKSTLARARLSFWETRKRRGGEGESESKRKMTDFFRFCVELYLDFRLWSMHRCQGLLRCIIRNHVSE